MGKVQEMLETYPRSFGIDTVLLAQTIEALAECANTCSQCADACLSEQGLSPELAKCIRLNLDCADVCSTTARVVFRQTEFDSSVTRALLEACVDTCRNCADECGQHASHMAHCRVCAESCRHCRDACADLVTAMGSRQ